MYIYIYIWRTLKPSGRARQDIKIDKQTINMYRTTTYTYMYTYVYTYIYIYTIYIYSI